MPTVALSETLLQEARELLIEAYLAKNGVIVKRGYLGGTIILAGGRTFNDPHDSRSTARWVYALDQLLVQAS